MSNCFPVFRVQESPSILDSKILYTAFLLREYLWTQNVFNLSNNTLDDLLSTLKTHDFGIFVLTPDNDLKMRKKEFEAARDNVVFELGLFMGALGKQRTFFFIPQNLDSFHLPSDLLGTEHGSYSGFHLNE